MKFENSTDKAKYVSFAFTWRNRIGTGGYPDCKIVDYRYNTSEYKTEGNHHYLFFSHSKPKTDRRLNGNVNLSFFNEENLDVSYMCMEAPRFNSIDEYDPNLFGSNETVTTWPYYKSCGKLPNMITTEKQTAGGLAVGKLLQPGEKLQVPFIVSWYLPEKTANDYTENVYKNMYIKWFGSSVEVAKYFHKHRERLHIKTKVWQNKILNSNLPEWLKNKIINDIFPLYSGSVYIDDGRFSINEAPMAMNGCMGTIDPRASSHSIYSMCFPMLSKSELNLISRQQI